MIRRSYMCEVCGAKWDVVCDKGDPDPDCTKCKYAAARDELEELRRDNERMKEIIESGKAPAVIGVKAKAIDIAQRMAEETMGLTDMNDNSRQGDVAYKPPAEMNTAEASRQAQELMEIARARAGGSASAMTPASPAITAVTGETNPADVVFGGSHSVQGKPGPHASVGENLAAIAPAAAAARASGMDPIAKLHQAGQEGLLGPAYEMVGKAPMPTETQL